MNLCGVNGEPERPGHPVVLFSKSSICNDLVLAESIAVHRSKTRRGINVFVTGPRSNDWRYLGEYNIVHEGITDNAAEPIPTGVDARAKMRPEVRALFDGHINRKGDKGVTWRPQVMPDWGFEGKRHTYEEALEQQKKGKSRLVMRYVVLKCVGFDEASFETWAKARGDYKGGRGGKGKRGVGFVLSFLPFLLALLLTTCPYSRRPYSPQTPVARVSVVKQPFDQR